MNPPTAELVVAAVLMAMVAAGAVLAIWSGHLSAIRSVVDGLTPGPPSTPPCAEHGWDCLLTDYQPHHPTRRP